MARATVCRLEPELDAEIKAIVDRSLELHRPEEASLISVLQDINRDLGYLPEPVLRYVSRKMSVPLLAVYHVATFYKAFSLTPRGKHRVRVCMGTACHVRGAPLVLEALKGRLGIEPGQTTADGKFTLETVNCLGTCAMGPVVVADEEYNTLRPGDVSRVINRLEPHKERSRRKPEENQSMNSTRLSHPGDLAGLSRGTEGKRAAESGHRFLRHLRRLPRRSEAGRGVIEGTGACGHQRAGPAAGYRLPGLSATASRS